MTRSVRRDGGVFEAFARSENSTAGISIRTESAWGDGGEGEASENERCLDIMRSAL